MPFNVNCHATLQTNYAISSAKYGCGSGRIRPGVSDRVEGSAASPTSKLWIVVGCRGEQCSPLGIARWEDLVPTIVERTRLRLGVAMMMT